VVYPHAERPRRRLPRQARIRRTAVRGGIAAPGTAGAHHAPFAVRAEENGKPRRRRRLCVDPQPPLTIDCPMMPDCLQIQVPVFVPIAKPSRRRGGRVLGEPRNRVVEGIAVCGRGAGRGRPALRGRTFIASPRKPAVQAGFRRPFRGEPSARPPRRSAGSRHARSEPRLPASAQRSGAWCQGLAAGRPLLLPKRFADCLPADWNSARRVRRRRRRGGGGTPCLLACSPARRLA